MTTISQREKYIRIHDLWTKEAPGLINSNYTSHCKGLFKDVLFEDYASLIFLWATEYRNELNVIKTNNLEILKLIEEELLK